MENNSNELWDKFWSSTNESSDDLFLLKKEENSIRWQRIESLVLEKFGTFKNLKVIEIGGGIGTISALMSLKGADITLIDYSEKALERAKEFYMSIDQSVNLKQQDALNLSKDLIGQFDISISLGLTEHFKGIDRFRINFAHKEVLKSGGIAFISVPNKFNPPYRIFKFLSELFGYWKVGEEYPYSRREFRRLNKEMKFDRIEFIGDSFLGSFFFINPLRIIRKLRGNKISYTGIRKQRGSFLDQYLGYALVFCGFKDENKKDGRKA